MSAIGIYLSEMNLYDPNARFHTGYVIYKRGSRFGPRTQNDLQLVYVYEGEMDIWMYGVPRHLEAGQTALLQPGHTEFFQFSRTGKTRHGWCTWITPDLSADVLSSLASLPFSLPFTSRTRRLARMARTLQLDATGNAVGLYPVICTALFLEFFRAAGLNIEASHPLPEPVRRAIAHMRSHLHETLTLNDLARAAGVTPAHLIRLFREHLQSTPMRHLWKLRVETGLRLLRDTGLQAGEIAYLSGFKTIHHFSRLVRQHTGTAPLAYRRKHWNRRHD